MMRSDAYLNHGQWVADCPDPRCTDARALYPEDRVTGERSPNPVYVQRCKYGHEFEIVAPPDEVRAQIQAALAERPRQYRDWLPAGHPWAAHGYPTAQSPADLIAENDELAKKLAPSTERLGSSDLADLLRTLGVDVRADGSFSGTLPRAE